MILLDVDGVAALELGDEARELGDADVHVLLQRCNVGVALGDGSGDLDGLEQVVGVVAVLGKSGTVHLVRDGVVLPTPALTMTGVCTESERGLLGIAAAPDLATTGHVYLYATRTAPGAPGGVK